MADFQAAQLTGAGLALLAKAHAGSLTMKFTKMTIGDGILPAGTNVIEFSALVNEVYTCEQIKAVYDHGNTAVILTAEVSTGLVSSGFFMREVGVWALDPDVGEVLYAYANAGDNTTRIPASGGGAVKIIGLEVYVVVSNSRDVTINLGGTSTNWRLIDFTFRHDLDDYPMETVFLAERGSGAEFYGGAAIGNVEVEALSEYMDKNSLRIRVNRPIPPGSPSVTKTDDLQWLVEYSSISFIVSLHSVRPDGTTIKKAAGLITAKDIDLGDETTALGRGQIGRFARISGAGTSIDDWIKAGNYWFTDGQAPSGWPLGTNGLLVVQSYESPPAGSPAPYAKQFVYRYGTVGSQDHEIAYRTLRASNGIWGPWYRLDVTLASLEGAHVNHLHDDRYLQTDKLIGEIFMFGGTVPPAGAVMCNGAAVSRTVYAKLYAIIGTAFGKGNGVDTFNVPDMRGVFPRGLDSGRGLDPDRVLGSYQEDAFRSHAHTQVWLEMVYGYGTLENGRGSPDYNGVYNTPTRETGGNETRPCNVAVNFCIWTGV